MRKLSKALTIAAAAVFLYPVLMAAIHSFESDSALLTRFTLFPEDLSLKQYYTLLFASEEYLYRFWYSLALCLGVTALGLCTSILVAQGLAMTESRARLICLYIVILYMTMPFQVTLLPQYLLSRWLGTYDTIWALILPQIFSPLGIFLLHQCFSQFPKEICEAAQLETGSYAKYLRYIAVPMIKPAIITLGLLLFSEAWGMIDLPLYLLKENTWAPISILVNEIDGFDARIAFAASILYMAPALLLFRLFQETIVEEFLSYPSGGRYEPKEH